MSIEQKVDDILLVPVEPIVEGESHRVLELAVQEAQNMGVAMGESFSDICAAVERATSKEALVKALGPFNSFMHIFLGMTSEELDDRSILNAVGTLPPSTRFQELLRSQETLVEAIRAYKTLVASDLAKIYRRKEDFLRASQVQDRELLDNLLPSQDTSEAAEDGMAVVAPAHHELDPGLASSKKRGVSAVADEAGMSRIPRKKYTIPALASVGIVSEASSTGLSTKKALMTRERLRAGLHDPRGLLNLVGSSTDALERTKKWELMKSAGWCFDDKKKNTTFSEKLNAATWRLQLGLGGQVSGDTLLFGQKVLSNPGSLSYKNISDIENNIIDGKTT